MTREQALAVGFIQARRSLNQNGAMCGPAMLHIAREGGAVSRALRRLLVAAGYTPPGQAR